MSSRWFLQRFLPVGISVVLALCIPESGAVSVGDWSASTAAGFARGTLEGTIIDERGRVALSPKIESIFGPEEGIVWGVAPAGTDAAFVALSGPGRVLRVGRSQAAEVWYDAGEEALITAIAADGHGGVFVGSSPSGRVLHLTGPGKIAAEAATGAKFVWALDTDQDGGVWIGTGVPGGVRRWTPGGDVRQVFDSGDDPVRSVLALARSTIVAGTGGRGRVIRLDDRGRAFVLYDADEKEVVDLAVNDAGTVFALTAGGAFQVGPAKPPADVERTPNNSVSVTASPPPGAPPTKDDKKADEKKSASGAALAAPKGGALYRIDPDGDALKIWSTASEIPFAIAIDGDGRVLAATGDVGKVYRVDVEGRSASLLRVASNQASALAVGAKGAIIIGGSSDARVSLLGPDVATEGDYLSVPIDAGTVADWGRVRWEADVPRGAAVTGSLRVGNTEEPDETWTDWMQLDSRTAGQDIKTEAPPARWMQLRLTLAQRRQARPTVSKIEAFFTPRNRPPQVNNVTVDTAGIVWVKGPVNTSSLQGPVVADDPVARRAAKRLSRKGKAGAPVRRLYELGARTFSWAGGDPDGDRLHYLVEIRREDSDNWFPLAADLEEEFFSWDARSMPDGLYRIRVTANDGRDNPGGKERTHQATSETFRIDNTRPTVDGPRVNRAGAQLEVQFVVSDPDGKIAAVEIAVDGGDWEPLDPTDGVADSAEETYRLLLPPVATADNGRRYFRVRATDTVGNLGGDAWLIPGDD